MFGLIFPSAFSGNHLKVTIRTAAKGIKIAQIRYPDKTRLPTPVAKMLVKRAGATDLNPAVTASANALIVPSVE